MGQTPNTADFSVNMQEGEYTAHVRVSGTLSIRIKADSQEAAERLAEDEIEKMEKDGFLKIDSIDEIELDRVRKDPPMYRVTREGKKMQVSRLDPGDTPRQPDERGF